MNSENTQASGRKPNRAPEGYLSPLTVENGMRYAMICHFSPGGGVQAGLFLLDLYCLGVKDAFYTEVRATEYAIFLDKVFPEVRESVEPACVRKLIEGAVAYARSFGLEPHRGVNAAARVLSGISSEDCTRRYTFGKDGKPFYIQGPHDSPARVQQILQRLKAKCGEGNYHFLMLADGAEGFFKE